MFKTLKKKNNEKTQTQPKQQNLKNVKPDDNNLGNLQGIGCLEETKRHRTHYWLPTEIAKQQQTLWGD